MIGRRCRVHPDNSLRCAKATGWVWGVDGDGRYDEDTARDGVNDDGLIPGLVPWDPIDARDGEDGIETTKLHGISPKPPCSHEPPSISKMPTVKDPNAFPGPNKIAQFGEVLAHETGHALCLGHAGPGNLMAPTGFGQHLLTPAQIATLRAQVDHLSFTQDRCDTGRCPERTRVVSRQVVDDIGDVPDAFIDIVGTSVARRSDHGLGLAMDLVEPPPNDISGLQYLFLVDVDNNAATGGQAAGPTGEAMAGIDLIVEVTIDSSGGQRAIRTVVKRFQAGGFVEMSDPRLAATLDTVPTSQRQGAARHGSLLAVIPADLLPVPLAEGYRVASFAFNPITAAADAAPVVVGSVLPSQQSRVLTLSTTKAKAGDQITVSGIRFAPNAKLVVYFGQDIVAATTTDALGSFSTRITVPAATVANSIRDTNGARVSPIMAVDESEAGDGTLFTHVGVPSRRTRK
jgi:hypothetical protein